MAQNKINYTLRKSERVRRVRLAVHCDGAVVVTAPVGVSEERVEGFVRDKAEWVREKITFFQKIGFQPVKKTTRGGYKKYKNVARKLVTGRLEYFNQFYQLKYNRVAIRNQRSRWGSCSKKGNLNFNYKIVFLPPQLADYVIVHELCHLQEFNHSQRFWALVAKTLPGYTSLRKHLKTIRL